MPDKKICLREEGSQKGIEQVKKMCRLLDFKRRLFLEKDWKEKYEKILSHAHFNHLMLIRFALPCNLTRIMEVTGLTSAGASIFIDSMVKKGILTRMDKPSDRRNVIIDASKEGKKLLDGIDDRINTYVMSHVVNCTEDELPVIAQAVDIICRRLSSGKK